MTGMEQRVVTRSERKEATRQAILDAASVHVRVVNA